MTTKQQLKTLVNNIWEPGAFGIVATPSVYNPCRWFIFRPSGVQVSLLTFGGNIVDSTHRLTVNEATHIINSTKQREFEPVYTDHNMVYKIKM